MNPLLDSYYQRPEVSNSDLSWLKNQLFPREMPDPTEAYRFGNLFDAMLTEQHRVNYFKMTCDGEPFKPEVFETAEKMKQAAYKDPDLKWMLEHSEPQKVMVNKGQKFNYKGNQFNLDTRCKWDIWFPPLIWGGDLKSTTATTQEQFEEAAIYFEYDRQRAWYMDIAGSDKDMLIAVSKKNFKIFKIFIKRGGPFYNQGRGKYEMLAFRWNLIFNNNHL